MTLTVAQLINHLQSFPDQSALVLMKSADRDGYEGVADVQPRAVVRYHIDENGDTQSNFLPYEGQSEPSIGPMKAALLRN